MSRFAVYSDIWSIVEIQKIKVLAFLQKFLAMKVFFQPKHKNLHRKFFFDHRWGHASRLALKRLIFIRIWIFLCFKLKVSTYFMIFQASRVYFHPNDTILTIKPFSGAVQSMQTSLLTIMRRRILSSALPRFDTYPTKTRSYKKSAMRPETKFDMQHNRIIIDDFPKSYRRPARPVEMSGICSQCNVGSMTRNSVKECCQPTTFPFLGVKLFLGVFFQKSQVRVACDQNCFFKFSVSPLPVNIF